LSEYEAGTFRCMDCGKEFLTKDAADKHHEEHHGHQMVGE
jgi:DNA-directed RNA polymerase subunit RPC12/RpoP